MRLGRKLRRPAPKLTYKDKFVRLWDRMKDPDWRRYFRLILAGKAIGLALLALAMLVVVPAAMSLPSALSGSTVRAQASAPAAADTTPAAAAPATAAAATAAATAASTAP